MILTLMVNNFKPFVAKLAMGLHDGKNKEHTYTNPNIEEDNIHNIL